MHLIPDAMLQNDNCFKVHKNGPRSFVDMTNKDVKNQFNTPIVYPQQFLALLQARLPDVYGARVQETTEGDLSPLKVYKNQRSRRSLSHSQDTQEPDTQSVSDIQVSPMMDPQEPGAQSVPDIHQTEVEGTDAAAQGPSPDKAATTDEQTVPVTTAIPDEGENPDEGATPDGKTNTDEATNADVASTAVEEAPQEPFTQSVKEGQAP